MTSINRASQPVANEEVVYIIRRDDADQEDELVFGTSIALRRFEQVSISWNAHLFAKVKSNSRDDRYYGWNLATPVAATQPSEGAKLADAQAPADTARLDWLQRGCTVELVPRFVDGTAYEWLFRIGGRRDTDNASIRAAIDAAASTETRVQKGGADHG